MNKLTTTISTALIGVVASATHAQTPYELIEQGNQQLEQGEAEQALRAYDEAAAALPDQTELSYNRAIAHYRLGEFAEAEALFEQSLTTRDPQLEARSRYNLGNVAYASAVQVKDQQPDRAVAALDTAIEHYRRTLGVTPDDTDARANIELAEMLKRQLEEQQKQEQEQEQQQQDQQQQDQQQQSDSQDEQSQDQQEQQSSDPNEQGKEGQEPEQQEPQENGDESQQQDSQQPNPDDAEQQQDGQDAKPQDSQAAPEGELKPANGEEAEPSNAQEPGEGQPVGEPKPLSPEEAQKLLQAIRDRDHQRRAEQVAREMAGQAPVEKDW